MATKVVYPFTSAQWKELERQAVIFKYMMESIPVPPDLLLPICTRNNFAAAETSAYHQTLTAASGGSIYSNLRYTNNNKDADPGRCRRTDGKKWRCSRDVAPNQKYCERHMHRGRPRSRKPVEVQDDNNNNNNNNKKTKTHPLQTAAIPQPNKSSPHQRLQTPIQPNGTNLLFLETTNTDLSISSYNNRGIGWMMEDKMLGMDEVEQQWPHLMDSKIALAAEGSIYDINAALFQQYFVGEPLNLFAYTDLGIATHQRNYDECQFLLNPEMVSLDKQPPQIENPRGFIDAWSNDTTFETTNEPPVSSSLGNLSPCSLTLSMAMAADNDNALDEEMGKIQDQGSGCSVKDSVEIKPKDSRCVRHSCWVPFARGGPLAEVLHTGSVAAAFSYPASPYTNNGDSISTPANSTVSSPSGVLHRALFSQSDTSVSNSPILYTSLHP